LIFVIYEDAKLVLYLIYAYITKWYMVYDLYL